MTAHDVQLLSRHSFDDYSKVEFTSDGTRPLSKTLALFGFDLSFFLVSSRVYLRLGVYDLFCFLLGLGL